MEDRIKGRISLYFYTEGPELGHGRIETRTYNIYDGLEIIAEKERRGLMSWSVECESDTVKKSTGTHTHEKRLYVTSMPPDTPRLGSYVRSHWSIESMHWGPDFNLL